MSNTPTETLARLLDESGARIVFDQKTVRALLEDRDRRIAKWRRVGMK